MTANNDGTSEIIQSSRFRGRSLCGISDLTGEELKHLLAAAHYVKKNRYSNSDLRSMHTGKTLASIYEKPSLRTRVTFEVAMTELGGTCIYLAPQDIQLGKRESVKDVAVNLARWVHGITARTFSHSTVTELAQYASVPVINALSDLEHPCQILADIQTIVERKCDDPFEPDLRGLKLVFVGDGNNVANSLLLACAKLGMDMTIACPTGYEPDEGIMSVATKETAHTGARLRIQREPFEAVSEADIIYTDVWASMGQEDEAEERRKVFSAYQVNDSLLSCAKNDAIVLHCLPAHREEEITSSVLDGPQSAALDEAENRLHAQKALLALVL